MGNRTWIYSRSCDESGTHLAMQTEFLRKYAADNGLELVGITEEHIPGMTVHRPGLAEVMQAAEQGRMDSLLIHSVSRIGRTLEVNEWINDVVDRCVEVRSVRDGLVFNDQNRPFTSAAVYYRVATEQQML